MATITITYDGQWVTTAVIACRIYGMQPQALRHTLARGGIQPVGDLDARTPLYLTADIERHMASRPGRNWRAGLSSATSG